MTSQRISIVGNAKTMFLTKNGMTGFVTIARKFARKMKITI